MALAMGGPVGILPPLEPSPPTLVIQKEVSDVVNNMMLSVTLPSLVPSSSSCSLSAPLQNLSPPPLMEACKRILIDNDQGGYTIPAKGLYPYQWNWDSALVSLGLAVLNETRAWEELEQLMGAQWEDGMIPSIIFHKPSSSYFPGPEIWGTSDKPRSSTGITQPPVAAISVRKLVEEASDTSLARAKAEKLFPMLFSWHKWFSDARDPEHTGLVATLHPWETGMDNSPAWDEPLERVPVDPIPPYVRCDTGHVDPKMRPQKAEYDRYLTLLYRFRSLDYDLNKLYFNSPFRVTDLCTNCVLHRANEDLLWLAEYVGADQSTRETIKGWISMSRGAFASLFDREAGLFKSKDQLTGELLPAGTSAGFLPLFAGVASEEEAGIVVGTLERWLGKVRYGVPSCDPEDVGRFEEVRYWRGPVWLIVNWMIVEGLRKYGFDTVADRVEKDSYELVEKGGVSEYFSPVSGAGAGGEDFSWTAAMCLAWLFKTF